MPSCEGPNGRRFRSLRAAPARGCGYGELVSTFAFIHGAGDSGWSWHLVEAELRARGHRTVAPDLPSADDSAGLPEYADTVVEAIGGLSHDLDRGPDPDPNRGLIVVGHSFGGFTAPLVADRLPTEALVFLAGMVPQPGEAPGDWWANTGYSAARREQAARDGGLTGNEDPYVTFYNDVPRALAEEALRRGQGQSGAFMDRPWPLAALPDVPTKFVVCTRDQFFPADFLRRVAMERLGIRADELDGSHGVALGQPKALADLLESYAPAT